MSYVVLARKWRPMSFDDLIGQDHVARTLAGAIEAGRVAHAFLFTGVRGVGKTTSARILAKALNCMGTPDAPRAPEAGPTVEPCLKCQACLEIAEGTDLDVREIDGASYTGIDDVRKLQDSLPYRPARDRYKIVIVDEVHMLSQHAWNAFLKTLEEPPPHVKFIFATTEVHKVPVTILSRVQRFDFKLIPTQLIADRIRFVLEREDIQSDAEAISIIAREAAGSMRDAMSILDQVISWGGSQLSGEGVARVLGVANRQVLHDIAGALIDGDAARCLGVVHNLANQGFDIGHVTRDLLALLRDLVVSSVCDDPSALLDLADEEQRDVIALAKRGGADDLMRLHHAFSVAFDDVVRGSNPRAALEMLLVRLARRPPMIPIDDIVERLKLLERRIASGGGSGTPSGAPSGSGPSRTPGGGGPPRRASMSAPDAPHSAPPPGTPRDQEALSASEPPPTATQNGTVSERPSRPVATRNDRAAVPSRAPSPAVATGAEEVKSRSTSKRAPDPLLGIWRSLLEHVAASRPEIAAILNHAVPVRLDGTEIEVKFQRGSVFTAQATSQDTTIELLAAAEKHFGRRPRLSVQTDVDTGDARTVSQENQEKRAADRQAAIDRATNHPVVVDAIATLGARIKEVRLQHD